MIGIENIPDTLPWTRTSRGGRIKQLIQERCGLYFQDHELKNLEQAVAIRMRSSGIASVDQYLRQLTGPDGREFLELLNLLTIRHTFFFRDRAQFAALREVVLPRLLEAKRRPSVSQKPLLRIWSAGCSTGEEPYSIAMVVADLVPALQEWDIEILAMDVSTQALEFARRGIYEASSMQWIEAEQRRRYFVETSGSKAGSTYRVRENIRALVRFTHQSLLEGSFPDHLDVIFCRNVMIYFDRSTMEGLIDRFRSSLVDDGYLFIGYSECPQSLSVGFKMLDHQDGVYYQKVPVQSNRRSGTLPQAGAGPRTSVQHGDRVKADLPAVALVQIEEAIRGKDYERALALIGSFRGREPNRVESYYWAAHVHTNQGDYGLAKAELERLLRINAFFAPAYYLRGTIHLQEQDLDQAKTALKQAIFLDPRLAMARLTLATVYQQEDETAEAIREYRNAAKLLSEGPAEAEVPYSGGFTRVMLTGVCQEAIERMRSES